MNIVRPSVDIIIPYHGCYESVTRCVASILACTPNQKFTIILVDDASANLSYLKSMSRGKVFGIRLEERSGFGAALNAGIQASKSEHVVFMHSDIWVDGIHWLYQMQKALYALWGEGVRLVSARTDTAGTACQSDELIIGRRDDKVSPQALTTAAPLFCSLSPREMFEHLGPIKSYPYAWYEDEELFWRMRYHGFKQANSPAWVNHEGGKTVQELWRQDPESIHVMEENQNRCLQDVQSFVKTHRQTVLA